MLQRNNVAVHKSSASCRESGVNAWFEKEWLPTSASTNWSAKDILTECPLVRFGAT
jgi:hypothetical protein